MFLKSKIGLRSLALFEAAKGVLVLLVGAGLLSLIHHNLQLEGTDIVRFFHLNPARQYPEIFLKTFSSISSVHLWFLSLSAILYAIIRFAEAYGLWHDRMWAVWFAIASDALFLPVEISELIERITPVRLSIFLLNVVLLLYLFRHARKDRAAEQ